MKIRLENLVPVALAMLALNLSAVRKAEAASCVTNGPLITARYLHTATLLPNGRVLVVGGEGADSYLSSAELYDPATGTWTNTGSLTTPRGNHTATLLPGGQVLVAGGYGPSGVLSSAELYDPATGMWTATGPLTTARYLHTATLLPNGQVLVAGGYNGGSGPLSSAELYNPASGTWTATGPLAIARYAHTATLLSDGQVLVTGGEDENFTALSSTEQYDPISGTWTTKNSLTDARYNHTATLLPNGQVLVAGGGNSGVYPLSSAELYVPSNGTWTGTAALNAARDLHTATLLPNGQVLIAGGYGGTNPLSSVELYDPANGTWTATDLLATARYNHTATLLPGGQVLVAGGYNFNSGYCLSGVELYDSSINPPAGTWTTTSPLETSRYIHTATMLPNGQVLVAGGFNANTLTSAELYDPATGIWTNTGPLNTAHSEHTATLLPNGRVLVAGGLSSGDTGSVMDNAELYDPAIETWTNTSPMNYKRRAHTATLIPSGQVLIAGGIGDDPWLSSAELYNPVTGMWTPTGSLTTARNSHTATLLSNGKVLVVGGLANFSGPGNSAAPTNSAELFDPATGTWIATGAMSTARWLHTATLLPNGKVLVAGGESSGEANSVTNGAELYDPATGTWMNTGAMNIARSSHTATLLANGKVLVTGGLGRGVMVTNRAELYDPATGTWTETGSLLTNRELQTATLLADGKLLVAGGFNGSSLSSAELYDVGLGYSNFWRPQIVSVTSPLSLGDDLALTGAQFRGFAEGSGGNTQDSSADYPVVQLRSVESGQTVFLSSTNWSTNSLVSLPVLNFPPGYALATVFVNGIQSTSSIVNISLPVPTAPTLTGAQMLDDGSFQFTFTNSVGALFGVLATTNLTLPVTSWTVLGGVTEISPGQFQFTDLQATNNPQQFYLIRSP